MSKWFEPELRNDFGFIFSKIEDGEKIWYKATIYADDCDFAYSVRKGVDVGETYASRYLKPNYTHELIGKVYVLEDYHEDDFWFNPGEGVEYSSLDQMIEFKTNEYGDINLEDVEFHDY